MQAAEEAARCLARSARPWHLRHLISRDQGLAKKGPATCSRPLASKTGGEVNPQWFLSPPSALPKPSATGYVDGAIASKKGIHMDQDIVVGPSAASPLVGLSVSTLAKLRVTGGGPVFVKAGRKVLYRKQDLIEWLDARRVRNTTEAANLPCRLTDLLGQVQR
jgi:hypothetical protein